MSDYKQHSVTITLNFDTLGLPECVKLDDVARMLTQDEWCDGRYPFDTEMVHVGLSHLLHGAISMAVAEEMDRRYGREMVKRGDGEESLAYIKAAEAMKGVSAHIIDSIKDAEIGKPVK